MSTARTTSSVSARPRILRDAAARDALLRGMEGDERLPTDSAASGDQSINNRVRRPGCRRPAPSRPE